MDVETAIRAFASAGHDLPREAMGLGARPLGRGRPRPARGAGAVRRRRGPVGGGRGCGLLHPPPRGREAGDASVRAPVPPGEGRRGHRRGAGDGVTTTLSRIMISTYDGNLDTLEGVIEADGADEYTRAGALEVLAYLAATGRVAREEAEAYLLRLYDALRPQHESFVWSGWALAVGLLGLEALSDVVRRAFGRGLIDPTVMGYEHFREDLGRTLADPERMAGFR